MTGIGLGVLGLAALATTPVLAAEPAAIVPPPLDSSVRSPGAAPAPASLSSPSAAGSSPSEAAAPLPTPVLSTPGGSVAGGGSSSPAPEPVIAASPSPAASADAGGDADAAAPPPAAAPGPAPAAAAETQPVAGPAAAVPPAEASGLPATTTPPQPGSQASPATGGNTTPPIELELRSDRQGYDAQLNRYVSSGNVSALVAGGRLLADRLEIDTDSRIIDAYGRVRFQRGQQYLQASRLRFSLLEGIGEMQDVYGVIDLDGSASDLDLTRLPSAPLPPEEPISCPPAVPAPPQWHPYPWAITAWAGQMFAANFGDTFVFKGRLRPEYLVGFGLQRRLLDAGPLALELDANLLGHRADEQPGGPYNQAAPYADTPAQSFTDATLGIGARLWLQPWLNLYFVEGVNLLSQNSNYERTFRQNYTRFLNYLAFEVEALVTPRLSAVGRIHHRSGAYGLYSGVSEGSNAYLLGLRYRWGQSPPILPSLELAPAVGCAATPPRPDQLASASLAGSAASPTAEAAAPAASTPPAHANPWSLAREQERLRQDAISRIDQRVRDVRFQQTLVLEPRRGMPAEPSETDAGSQFGGIRPSQLDNLNSETNRETVRGTISRWRLQARLLRLTPTSFSADRIAFTNDPFTPAQAWLDATDVVATLRPNGDTVIKAQRNRLRLEDRLPLALPRRIRIRRSHVESRLMAAFDKDDRDGAFVGYNIPILFGESLSLNLQPQFLVQRAIDSSTSVYPLPGQSVVSAAVTQPATSSDLFGLQAKLSGPMAGFIIDGQLEVSSFNPDHIAAGTRSWGDLRRPLELPLLGDSTWRLFGAYRYRIWNGSLGEQDVIAAYGTSLERRGEIDDWGPFSGSFYWRFGAGRYQSNLEDSQIITQLWRGGAVGSLNLSLPLWTGKPAPATPAQGLLNSPEPVVPGLSFATNLLGSLAYYGDGTNQNTITLSGGPTLTLGHFVRPFLDYTSLTITGSGTLRQGLSPFGFDRAVDLGALGVGLTQQIAGPLVFSGGIGFNVDPRSENYGDVVGSYMEFRWQRRAYEVGIFYSPYQKIGGIRLRLNDFSFTGPGRPFVPYNPVTTVLDQPF